MSPQLTREMVLQTQGGSSHSEAATPTESYRDSLVQRLIERGQPLVVSRVADVDLATLAGQGHLEVLE